MTPALLEYLQRVREQVVGALDGLSDYDVRRPLVPSGTNLLGLVKHLIGVEAGYLGDCVGRPSPVSRPWEDDGSVWQGADMWARADEPRADLLADYRRCWRHSDETVAALGPDAAGRVPWWPPARWDTDLGTLLVRVLADTAQHAGHADILREQIDGRGGRDYDEAGDAAWWAANLARIQAAADVHRLP